MFVHQKENPQKSQAKVKKTREEMLTILYNGRKVIVESPISVLYKKNKVKEGGALGSRVKREQEST